MSLPALAILDFLYTQCSPAPSEVPGAPRKFYWPQGTLAGFVYVFGTIYDVGAELYYRDSAKHGDHWAHLEWADPQSLDQLQVWLAKVGVKSG